MIAYSVQITTHDTDQFFDLGVKCQGNIYLKSAYS